MTRIFLRSAPALALSLLFVAPREARATACATDTVPIEPTNIEIVVTPPVDCLKVEAISAGCGDSVAIRIVNGCQESAFVSGDVQDCVETPCEVLPDDMYFVDVAETEGRVEISFTLTVGLSASEVDAAFDIEEQPATLGESGCSAARGPERSAGWLPLLAAFLLLRRRQVAR